MRNRVVLRTLPWGTPSYWVKEEEIEEKIWTRKEQWQRNDWIKTVILPLSPREASWCKIWYRHVVSYAFSKSKKTARTDSRWPKADLIYVSIWVKGSAVLQARQNPNWLGKEGFWTLSATLVWSSPFFLGVYKDNWSKQSDGSRLGERLVYRISQKGG